MSALLSAARNWEAKVHLTRAMIFIKCDHLVDDLYWLIAFLLGLPNLLRIPTLRDDEVCDIEHRE